MMNPEETTAGNPPLERFGWLALVAAIYTYVLVVYGGIVRITGSGMGCGDDWPHCNGAIVPAFDLPTFIEYTHRVLGAGLILITLVLLVRAVRNRGRPAFARAGVLGLTVLAAVLIVVQALLGAVTVKLELPAGVTAVHFMMALVLLALFQAMAVRAGTFPRSEHGDPAARAAMVAMVLGFVVIGFGALTANVGMDGPFPPSGAAMACQGFPLCNGQLVPEGNAWIHIHWTHRLTAFLLFFHVLAATILTLRRPGSAGPARRAAVASLAAVTLQLAVAAALVLTFLPPWLQGLHLVVGGALWSALVFWAGLTRPARAPAEATGATATA